MCVLFFWVHGEWIVARNKQIAREPLRGSRDLFDPRYDSFPINPEKKDTHSLNIRQMGSLWRASQLLTNRERFWLQLNLAILGRHFSTC